MSNEDVETEEFDMKIKYGNEVHEFYDIPVDVSNEKLLSQIVLEICTPELKLPGGKMIKYIRPKYTFLKWKRKHGNSLDELRGVLNLKTIPAEIIGGDGNSGISGKLEENEITIKKLEQGKKNVDEKLKKLNMLLSEKDRIIEKGKGGEEKLQQGKEKVEEELEKLKRLLSEKNEIIDQLERGKNKAEEEVKKLNITLKTLVSQNMKKTSPNSAGEEERTTLMAHPHQRGEERSQRNMRQLVIDVAGMLDKAHKGLWGLNGLKMDYFTPHQLYEEIVNHGGSLDANALWNLGYMYEDGCGVEKILTTSKQFYRKAAEMYKRKTAEASGGNEDDHLEPTDLKTMGMMYVYGDGFKSNRERGAQLLIRAAERGNELAMRHLGQCYRKGLGVPKCDSQSFKCYAKAAEAGLPLGMHAVGFMYENGYGVKKNVKLACQYFRKAAWRGVRKSMFKVGECHKKGNGAEKNTQMAKIWYKMAADLGHAMAERELRKLRV